MHIPPYHKKMSWQRFFIGLFFGALISYGIVIYMYGQMYEDLLEKNLALQSELSDVKKQNESLLKTNEDLDEQSKKPITVESIDMVIENKEELKLDTFTVHKLEDLIKQEIDHLVGQDVYIVSESEELLIAAIENNVYEADDFSYEFEISKLTISNHIKITVDAKLS
ncbi:hypothetical protein KQI49_14850 [Virgibacillus sp. MSJ-26]|uniref:sporulation membrane protein YtrI n=1 Tax=Virgibacillus sp. MSJ-26 TaxID=2841522 RepID=UPI001C0FB336|nr:sporulation membrane protein YtrI [Virgibacillus sp. MSJ-26]MBU5468105.1 hypothetical protein [Virgibacillus sp. MSJ-26]